MVKEAEEVIKELREGLSRVREVLNPELGRDPGSVYEEALSSVKGEGARVSEARLSDERLRALLIDDYDLISSKIKELGMTRLVVKEAVRGLRVIKKALPSIKEGLSELRGLLKEHEEL